MTTIKINPHRPYYRPGLQHRNYTNLASSNEETLGTIPLLEETTNNNNNATQLKSFTAHYTSFALMKYFETMLTSPFEVGTTLLQVQYSPHEDVEVFSIPNYMDPSALMPRFDNSSDEEDDEEVDMFYKRTPTEERASMDTTGHYRIEGSFLQSSVYDEKNRPQYQMAPLIEGGGVLEILSRIIKQPTEGWRSLFKGQRVTWVYELLHATLRPAFEDLLNDLFGLYDHTIPLLHLDSVSANITTLVASHVVIGVLLSPLEIARTRLVVQSYSPSYNKYKGPFHALRTMLTEEGGIYGVYCSKNIVPTILYHSVKPLIACSTPLIVSRMFQISAADSPILFGVAELALSTFGLLIMLPLETIRKRLHVQLPSNSNGEFMTTVAVRPQPYRGILDAVYKIMKEEGTKNKKSSNNSNGKKKLTNFHSSEEGSASDSDEDLFPGNAKHPPTVSSAWGIRGLYRGFSTQVAANVMVFIFHTLNGIE